MDRTCGRIPPLPGPKPPGWSRGLRLFEKALDLPEPVAVMDEGRSLIQKFPGLGFVQRFMGLVGQVPPVGGEVGVVTVPITGGQDEGLGLESPTDATAREFDQVAHALM